MTDNRVSAQFGQKTWHRTEVAARTLYEFGESSHLTELIDGVLDGLTAIALARFSPVEVYQLLQQRADACAERIFDERRRNQPKGE